MNSRILKLSRDYSFFLFGARGVGKTTLLHQQFKEEQTLWLDLLNPELEAIFMRDPGELTARVLGMHASQTHVVIDEIQKVPKLLDVVHQLLFEKRKHFILTGSSARKLKQGAANLLAGRAFVYALFPFCVTEMGATFSLEDALQFGLLPQAALMHSTQDKMRYLQAYVHIYLKEEVYAEQLVRNLAPFRRFLEVAAQMNGKIINYHRIAVDTGVDDKTVKNYYSILEDTLIGFSLEPFHHSFRKRLAQKPKFYFIDLGVARSLSRTLSATASPGTSFYGDLFESFVITEIYKLCQYAYSEYRLSFIRTKDDVEVDLVVERPGQKCLLIEIKSAAHVDASMLQPVIQMRQELEGEAVCLSQDPVTKQFEGVLALHWLEGLKQFFAIPSVF